MAFLFKSKKQQQSTAAAAAAASVKESPTYTLITPNAAKPAAVGASTAIAKEPEKEKESIPRSSPPHANNRAAAAAAAAPSSFSHVPTSGPDLRPVREQRPEPDVQPPRAGSVSSPAPQPQSNPNALLYPWSQRRFQFSAADSNPFPRYGAAVNAVASKEGEIYMMGGLIDSSLVKGDLWMVEAEGPELSCYPVGTTADSPGPRVGHASLIVGNAFIVFGGDTKSDERDELDDALYLLNTATRQWSKTSPPGIRPTGRYGHTLNIVGSKLYAFGGQVEGSFFNDLVAFDLNALQQPTNQWEVLIPNSADGGYPYGPVPPARTNHTVVNWGEKLFLFGGTNSAQWFNDVWTYDPRFNRWSQLDCIGYIPVPREGHAAALVGDVMYIFGGRTEEGNDLGDLAAFRISSRRWYTFQNMGPSPSPRSGHSMTAHGKQIVVLGGEPSSAPRDAAELSLVYVLDTGKIRYPADQPPPSSGAGVRRPSGADRTVTPSGRSPHGRDGSANPADARDPRRIMPGPRESVIGNGNPYPPRAAEATAGGHHAPSRLPRATTAAAGGTAPSQAPSGPPPPQQAPPPRTNGILPSPPGPRSKTPTRVERGMSPAGDGIRSGSLERESVSPISHDSLIVLEQPAVVNGRRTPTTTTTTTTTTTPPPPQRPTAMKLVEGEVSAADESLTRSRSLTGRPQAGSDDAQEPTNNGHPAPNRWRRPEEPPSTSTESLIRRRSSSESRLLPQLRRQTEELSTELTAARSRNAWYASEMALARRAGYAPNPSDSPLLDEKAAETFGDKDRPLIEAFLAMRAELARVQGAVDAQAALAATKIAEAENQRDVAVSEVVYVKAKLAAHGGGRSGTPQPDQSSREVADREGERAVELNRRLASSLAFQAELQSQLARLEVDIKSERQARQLAEALADAAELRIAELDSYKQRATSEMEGLRADLHQAQKQGRDEAGQRTEATTKARLLETERDDLRRRLDEALQLTGTHTSALDRMRDAVVASTDKATFLEKKLEGERHHHENVERKLRHLRAEHEEMTAELETVARRLHDAEELVDVHSAEADKHRAVVLSGLGRASSVDRDLGEPGRSSAEERLAILQGQIETSTALVQTSQAAADAASEKLRAAEARIAGLESYQEQMSREGLSIRRQLQASVKQTQILQTEHAEIRAQLANQQLEANAMAVRHGALRDLLSERGINVSELRRSRSLSRQGSGAGTPDQSRMRELEQQLEATVRSQNALQSSIKTREQEADRAYREKLEQLQNDYQSAVHYVKGTEKMLERIKGELSKYKSHNAHLQAELDETQKARAAGDGARASSWETERKTLHGQIDALQQEVTSSTTQLQQQMEGLQGDLQKVQRERDTYQETSQHVERELAILAEQARADLEQLKHENSLLESRAQDAEQKVVVLLDQLVTSVDNYRRQSRQVEMSNGVADPHPRAHGHRREDSVTSNLSRDLASSSSSPNRAGGVGFDSAGSTTTSSSFRPDTRNSVALDSLASELETLRSHWETTNRNYRLSNTFDFEKTPTSVEGGELSNSLANWRKRLDLEEQEAAAAAATAGGQQSTKPSRFMPEQGTGREDAHAQLVGKSVRHDGSGSGGGSGDTTPRRKGSRPTS